VWHELSFGLESLGFANSEIRTRVSEMASFFGIESWFHKKVTELSGGQKQILNLASIMAMSPSVLILDEPTSQLDPISAQDFLQTVLKINRELGTTVILSEHRLQDAVPISDRVIVMDSGKIIANGTPCEVGKVLKQTDHDMYLALPIPMRVYGEVENGRDYPLNVRDGRLWLEKYAENNSLKKEIIPQQSIDEVSEGVIELKDVWFRYKKDLPDVIKGLSVKVNRGEIFAFVGGNGTGKTTALSLISGLNYPYRGEVYIKGEKLSKVKNLYNGILGVLPQNPQSIFVKNTVYSDLMEILSESNLSKEEKDDSVKNVAKLCHIESLMDSHPYDLSGGEQQRAALAKILLTSPEILLLDEPTKGFDAQFKQIFGEILKKFKARGTTVLLVSHDIEFCAEFADRCGMFFDGNITSLGPPREFFSGKTFYTTQANRMARTVLKTAVLAEDIIRACGKDVKKPKKTDADMAVQIKSKTDLDSRAEESLKPKKKIKKKTVFTTFLSLFLMSLTIYIGTEFFGSRKYYFISLLIILETILPFCLSFESRKPKAREIVIISVLCAIAVIGRTAFAMLPQFKPALAVIIISGMCLGGETGFLVGALTAFVSNFFLGQGPWTPWQMFSFGVIGFISGVLLKNSSMKKSKVFLCVFGFLAALVIYGGIMNPASVIMWQDKITLEMIITSYAVGIPFDLVHGLSTAIFLWFILRPMTEKLERIKTKYGLIS